MPTSPRALYQARLQKGEIDFDAGQGAVVEALEEWAALAPRQGRGLPFLGGLKEKRGLYIYGPVGRGKTMLMDLFYESVEGIKKRRVHFHEFMLDVHARLHALKGAKNP